MVGVTVWVSVGLCLCDFGGCVSARLLMEQSQHFDGGCHGVGVSVFVPLCDLGGYEGVCV